MKEFLAWGHRVDCDDDLCKGVRKRPAFIPTDQDLRSPYTTIKALDRTYNG